jgi:hypothetical protein
MSIENVKTGLQAFATTGNIQFESDCGCTGCDTRSDVDPVAASEHLDRVDWVNLPQG